MLGLIPARRGVAAPIRKGECIKIINTHGKQVIDFWAFDPQDKNGYLSMAHTRTILSKVAISPGDHLYSTRRKPMLQLIEDTTPGVHDLLWSACDAERYRMLGAVDYHDNCSDNLHRALRPHFEIAEDWTPDPLNLFMNVAIDHHGRVELRPSLTERGQYVVMRAEQDLVVVMSACPQDMVPISGGTPKDCQYEVCSEV